MERGRAMAPSKLRHRREPREGQAPRVSYTRPVVVRGASRRRVWLGRWLAAAVACAAVAAAGPVASVPALPYTPLSESPGALLRSAVEAEQAGELSRAERLLRRVAERHRVVADHADLLHMRLLVGAGRLEDAVALEASWEHSESPLNPEFLTLLGDAHAGLGDEIAARSAWEFARLETQDSDRLAALHLASARSYERSGELATAAGSYLRIWTAYPLSDEAVQAEERLDALSRELDQVFRSGLAWRRRGDALYRKHDNEAALRAYERALQAGELSAAQRDRALRQRAGTLFRLRRYPDAVAAYAALPQDAEARIQRARAMARAGRVEKGAAELEALGRSLRGRQAARAKFLAALLWEGEEDEARARRLFAEVVRLRPRSSYARESVWRLGWAAYREARFGQAVDFFRELERLEESPIAALRPRYWGARASQRAGLDGGGAELTRIALDYPFSYYGWRASARAEPGAAGPPRDEVKSGTAALRGAQLERPRILLEAGLGEAAREELDRLFVSARGIDDRLSLAELYSNAGDYNRPQRLVVDAYQEELAKGPAPSQLELWWHAWPAPFPEEVQRATLDAEALEPELVWSIMREESGYRPEVVSVSGARGLLQLMPATAAKLAERMALPAFEPDDLFDPAVNIRLGAAYLNELLSQFEGRHSAAIGSYNAGPHRVVRWLEASSAEDDEWVESIAYDQTRAYVKRVLRSLQVYRVLY